MRIKSQMNRKEKNKMMVAIRETLPAKYLNILRSQSAEQERSMSDIVIEDILKHDKQYRHLKSFVKSRGGKMKSYLTFRIINYYK